MHFRTRLNERLRRTAGENLPANTSPTRQRVREFRDAANARTRWRVGLVLADSLLPFAYRVFAMPVTSVNVGQSVTLTAKVVAESRLRQADTNLSPSTCRAMPSVTSDSNSSSMRSALAFVKRLAISAAESGWLDAASC